MSQDITHQELKQGIDSLDCKFTGLSGRFDGFEQKFDGLNQRLDDMMQFMVKMMEYVTDNFATKEEMGNGFRRLENRIDEVDSHCTQNTLQIIALENKMDVRFDLLERRTLEDVNAQNKTIFNHGRRITRLEKAIA